MGNRDTQAALDYHEATKHSERSIRANGHFLDWANQPLPFKIYRDLEPIPLAKNLAARNVSALEAISRSSDPRPVAGHDARIPELAALSRVLYLGAGITKWKRHAGGVMAFRSYANTGALYHVDLYLVTGGLHDLPDGVYHFGPHDFALRQLRTGDYRRLLVEASGENPEITRAPVVVVSASTYWRNAWKYQARAYRHCFWDGGTLHANLLAAAAVEDLEPSVVIGYADRPVEKLLGLDPLREGTLTLVPLGRSRQRAPPAPEVSELRLQTEPLSRSEVDYPEIRAAHVASALADGAEAASWRGSNPANAERKTTGSLHLLRPKQDSDLAATSFEDVIRKRGSTRAFDPTRSLSFGDLSTVLDRSTRGVPADFLDPAGASLLDLYLIVNDVRGLPAGAYYYRRREQSLELLREGDSREVAGRLDLDQKLAADAAVNVYSLTDLGSVLVRFGNRGYRAAQLEGGITGGRMYLAAYAQSFGASGLTFFDDEVTEFFGPHAAGKSVMFLVALGCPYRALPKRLAHGLGK